jgi:hypothetical protein
MRNSNDKPARDDEAGRAPRSDSVEGQGQDDTERERADGPLSRPDEYGANEREQTVERERAGRTRLDEAGQVTDAEVEARAQRRARDH